MNFMGSELGVSDGRGLALARAADAMLRALGGTEMALQLLLPTATSDTQSELGRAAAEIDEVWLSPAVLRPLGDDAQHFELLLSAAAVASAAEARNFNVPREMFGAALGVAHNGKLLRIAAVSTESFAGAVYLYRVALSA